MLSYVKQFFAAIFFALLANFAAQAQQVQIGVTPELNFPTGNSVNLSGIGFGASVKAEVSIAEKHAITASGGYNTFIGKKYFGNRTPNISGVPVKLGLKYYSTPDFYLEAQGGAAFRTGTVNKTSFVWSPGIGTYFKTANAANKIDFSIRYEAWTNASYAATNTLKTTSFGFIGLRLGYNFGV